MMRFGVEQAIVITRYDRTGGAGRWRRVHQEDLCQALGVHPANKYQHDSGPSPEQAFHLFAERMTPTTAEAAAAELVDALAFNWLVGGTDAHGKNYSLLLQGGDVRLAPLYDIASVLPHPDTRLDRLRLAMKVGGEYRMTAIRRRHWERVAASARLPIERVVDRVLDLADRLPAALADVTRNVDDEVTADPLPTALVDAVAAWTSTCAATIRRGG